MYFYFEAINVLEVTDLKKFESAIPTEEEEVLLLLLLISYVLEYEVTSGYNLLYVTRTSQC
jgi:hypothetical protein